MTRIISILDLVVMIAAIGFHLAVGRRLGWPRFWPLFPLWMLMLGLLGMRIHRLIDPWAPLDWWAKWNGFSFLLANTALYLRIRRHPEIKLRRLIDEAMRPADRLLVESLGDSEEKERVTNDKS